MFFKSLKKISFIVMIALIAVLLAGCGKDKPEELLAEAKSKILVDGSISNLISDINLQEKVTIKDSKGEEIVFDIVWSASESAHFSVEVLENGKVLGKVARPAAGEEQAEATLKATLTYEKKTAVREWTVYIAPLPASEKFTIAEAIGQPLNTIVEVEGIVTYIMAGKGFFMKDETASIYVYTNGAVREEVKPGAKVKVAGKKIVYYDLYELEAPVYEVLTAAPAAGFDFAAEAVKLNVTEIDAKAFKGTESIPNYGAVYTVTGKIEDRQVGENKTLYIVNPLDGKQIEIYYGAYAAALAEIKALDGKTVEFTGLVYDHHSNGYWRMLPYAGTAKEVAEVVLTPQQKVDRVLSDLGALLKANQEVVANLTLPVTNAVDAGVAIVWASSNEAVIGHDGKLTAPSADTNVTLTATITLGDLTETFEVVVLAKQIPVTSILVAINKAEGTTVAVEGHVTYVVAKGYFLNDGTASIYVYINAAPAEGIKPGAKVKAIGKKSVYFDLFQIQTPTSEVIEEAPAGDYDYASKAVESTIDEIDAKASSGAESIGNYGAIYKFSGVVELRVNGKYTDVYLVDAISGKYVVVYSATVASAMADVKALEGKTAQVTAIIYDHHSGGYWRVLPYAGSVSEVAGVELSDQDKVDAAKIALETAFVADQEVKKDLELPVDDSRFTGLVIGWGSSHEAIIAVDGKFVSPAVDTPVTLTATITLNDATETFSVIVLAKFVDLTPGANLFFSEYIEGANGQNKALEIYNNSGSDVDLSGYSVELYANGNSEVNSYGLTELTGILKAGETFVIINMQADHTELMAKANLAVGSISHNGDDFYILRKGDEILDSFGQYTVDPGTSYGTTVTTVDVTLVRKSSVTTGDKIINDEFDPATEWIQTYTWIKDGAIDGYGGLGSHTID